jgi:hypothetical protein
MGRSMKTGRGNAMPLTQFHRPECALPSCARRDEVRRGIAVAVGYRCFPYNRSKTLGVIARLVPAISIRMAQGSNDRDKPGGNARSFALVTFPCTGRMP